MHNFILEIFFLPVLLRKQKKKAQPSGHAKASVPGPAPKAGQVGWQGPAYFCLFSGGLPVRARAEEFDDKIMDYIL